MTHYEIKVSPRVGEPFSITFPNAVAFSQAVIGYRFSGIAIEFDRSLLVSVSTRLA